MKTLAAQLKFDGKRQLLRNIPFLFFTILMPAGFYFLFTRVLASGSASEIRTFARAYMGSMIVYSLLICAFFGLSAMLHRDRKSGLHELLGQTHVGVRFYFLSIACWFLLLSLLSVGVIGLMAAFLNHVNLSVGQWFGVGVTALFGELPLLVFGAVLSLVKRQETLSVLSNLITFPLAFISGLLWPINMLPDWLQTIGKATPTYLTFDLLNAVDTSAKIPMEAVVGILVWLGIALLLLGGLLSIRKKWGFAGDKA